LSVEEQYYVLFPIIFIVIFKYFRKYLFHFLLLGLITSLLLADLGSKNYPSSTFYFLHTRIWELICGSLLAYLEIKLGRRGQKSSWGKAVGLFFEKFFEFNFNDLDRSETSFDLKKRFDSTFNLFDVNNINDFSYKIKNLKKRAALEDNLSKLNVDINKNLEKIIGGINLLRLSNNPVKI